MFYVLCSTPNGDRMTLSIEPDWDHACFAGLPKEPERAPDGLPSHQRDYFMRETKYMADHQSIVIVLHGSSQVQQFVTTMRTVPKPWNEMCAALCHVAEQAGHVAAAHIWMPNFYETDYGRCVSDHIKTYEAN